ncbi:Fumarylacetoacetate (FAA) hydrolase [Nitrosococcus oceani ATCC 19707]|uniref:Fumarylacetoacetate (FAA) hydrolase n=2 Tax=Nitrosococcus oceani TaxID=1229 RepID=Q3JB68_NITOC|nr:fumarylacetoacetate hydrolase family protein [Nitrosococcus oceani]ABA57928.1 Fumarylacetoacetate (FAA) hydrolase [Nitrosococcus oceani ATCC 19707]EDZ68128.1 fumarylacetoacetate hydrolase family protein, putative [Nitrosococcus oceani AFC27]KFI19657.1 2-keto-4-pentenoate hydratase [Nitrosococcus oceani C-27]GEM19571.1 fumarylacetoacetate hydrolase [Nitrosococcus oceani]
MKLATLNNGTRDGSLIVVNRNLQWAALVPHIATTLQGVLDEWDSKAPRLEETYRSLNKGEIKGFSLPPARLAAPFPRAYQWLDGSAYLSHVERVRKARGAEMPQSFWTDPLMYQGGSDYFLGPRESIRVMDEAFGVDFEAEVVVITDDVPLGITPAHASSHIKLLTLVNDISLRHLIPAELAKGFGFVQGKPASALAPVVVTPDELGEAWDGAKVHLPLRTYWNGKLFGEPEAGEDMQFDFPQLISHAAKTRSLSAGTLIGSGTVSNVDWRRGYSCIAECRVMEIIARGSAATPFMSYGDRVRIEMEDRHGRSIFGAIEQEVSR